MRIMQLADMHLGKSLHEYSLIEEQKVILQFILDKVIKTNTDVVCICGDIYDRQIPSTDAIIIFEEFVSKLVLDLQKKVIVISGNHDQNLRLSSYSNILRSNNLYFAKVFENIIESIIIDDVVFYLFPFTSYHFLKHSLDIDFESYDEALKHIISKINFDKTKKNILLAHDYIASINSNVINTDSERRLYIGGSMVINADILKDFDLVMLGHLHTCQNICDNIYYSGSIMKYSFSESMDKKYILLHDTSNLSTKKIELPINRDLVIIKGELNDLLDKSFYTKYKYQHDFFKAILTDKIEVMDAANKLKNIYTNLLEINKEIYYETSSSTIAKAVDIVDNLKTFFKELYDYNLENNELEILKSLMEDEMDEN